MHHLTKVRLAACVEAGRRGDGGDLAAGPPQVGGEVVDPVGLSSLKEMLNFTVPIQRLYFSLLTRTFEMLL